MDWQLLEAGGAEKGMIRGGVGKMGEGRSKGTSFQL